MTFKDIAKNVEAYHNMLSGASPDRAANAQHALCTSYSDNALCSLASAS